MPFISPSMEAEIDAAAKSKAEKELAEKNAAAADVANKAQQALQALQKLSAVSQNGPAGAMALANGAAGIAGGKAAADMAKVQQAAQVAKMVAGFAGSAPPATAITQSAQTIPASNAVSATAASLLPVKVSCEVNIDGNIISPVLSLQLSQIIGTHNKLIVRFHHDLVQDYGALLLEEKAQALLGKVVEVIIKDINSPDAAKLEDVFVITSVDLDEEALAEGMISLTCHSPSWVLDSAPHYQSFYKKPLDKIAETICAPLGNVKGKLLADPSFKGTILYACCFNESHWNFLKRISAVTGQWLYYSAKGLVFGKPPMEKPFKLVYGQNCYHLSMGVRATAVQTGLFDYEAASHNPIKEKANDYTGNIGSYAKDAFDKSKTLFTAVAHTGSSSMVADKGLLEVIGKARSASQAAGLYTLKGSSTVYGLSVGALVNVEFKRLGQTAQHSDVRIVSVQHHYTAGGRYENNFTAILSTAELPPPIAYTQPQTHPMLAQVTDNKDPQNQGRVKVKFMGWVQEDEQTTDWLRVLTPDAGGGGDKVARNRGLVTIPEVGDQVMIDFELNNPERPFITGSVFHGQHGSGGGDANKIKSLTTRSGNTISLDDAKGSLHAADSKGNMMDMDGAGNIHVKSSVTILLECGDSTIKLASDGTITIQGKKLVADAETSTHIGTKGTMEIKAVSTLKASSDASFDVSSPKTTIEGKANATMKGALIDVIATGDTNIKGAEVKLNC